MNVYIMHINNKHIEHEKKKKKKKTLYIYIHIYVYMCESPCLVRPLPIRGAEHLVEAHAGAPRTNRFGPDDFVGEYAARKARRKFPAGLNLENPIKSNPTVLNALEEKGAWMRFWWISAVLPAVGVCSVLFSYSFHSVRGWIHKSRMQTVFWKCKLNGFLLPQNKLDDSWE